MIRKYLNQNVIIIALRLPSKIYQIKDLKKKIYLDILDFLPKIFPIVISDFMSNVMSGVMSNDMYDVISDIMSDVMSGTKNVLLCGQIWDKDWVPIKENWGQTDWVRMQNDWVPMLEDGVHMQNKDE